MLNFYPFQIDISPVDSMTPEQQLAARYRIAQNLGNRAGFAPIIYVFLLMSVTIATENGWLYFQQYWYLELILLAISVGRLSTAYDLAHSEIHNFQQPLKNYYSLSLTAGLLWGVINAMMLWADQLQVFSYLVLSLTIATTGGAIGTMSSYIRTVTQFIFIKWLPIIIALALLSYSNHQENAALLLFMIILMMVFVVGQARLIAHDNQLGILRQIQLETRSNELAAALQTIEQQQQEVGKHRDHLQELVDEKTIDLIKEKEKAEQADMAKGEFLANMSHELRTPLHSILSFSHFGMTRLGQVDDKKIREYFEKINYSGEVQLSLVNDLLDLSRIEFKKEALFFQPCDLRQLTCSVISELSSLYEEKKINIVFDDKGKKITVDGDDNKIKQLLRNLLGNAIKFSPPQSTIMIRMFKSSGSIRLEIEDQGPGVPDDEKESIFDKFSQSSRTRTGAGGTGLGLAICAQIMQLHKGDIWVEDAHIRGAQGGARFVVVFPPVT